MRSTVTLVFADGDVPIELPAAEAPGPAPEARRWLDEQFLAHDCEPLRASGKVLTADKLLAVAEAIGARGFAQDDALRLAFARAAVAALGQRVLRIDVEARAVTY